LDLLAISQQNGVQRIILELISGCSRDYIKCTMTSFHFKKEF
jgi:hypothetical protein